MLVNRVRQKNNKYACIRSKQLASDRSGSEKTADSHVRHQKLASGLRQKTLALD